MLEFANSPSFILFAGLASIVIMEVSSHIRDVIIYRNTPPKDNDDSDE